MSEPVADRSAASPGWLPDVLESTWVFLSDYPIVLSLIILAVGLMLAVGARKFILFWGSKITARTTTDLDKVCSLLSHVAAAHPEVTKDPEPRVRNRGFGDSSIDFELLCWIRNPADRGRIQHDLYMAVDKAFNREKVVIPFPQRDVWVKQVSPQEERGVKPVSWP